MTQVNNNATLIGRLVRDIEGIYVKDGEMFIGTATLAVDRRGEGADYIRIKLLGNQWEKVANYMNKGTQVAVVGHVQTGQYEDADGNRHYTTDVIVDNLQLLAQPRGVEAKKPETKTEKKAPAKRTWKKK